MRNRTPSAAKMALPNGGGDHRHTWLGESTHARHATCISDQHRVGPGLVLSRSRSRTSHRRRSGFAHFITPLGRVPGCIATGMSNVPRPVGRKCRPMAEYLKRDDTLVSAFAKICRDLDCFTRIDAACPIPIWMRRDAAFASSWCRRALSPFGQQAVGRLPPRGPAASPPARWSTALTHGRGAH